MTDVSDLYQELIIDHSRSPRNFRRIDDAARAVGYNPLCGDKVTVYVRLDGDRIGDASFEGEGCAISRASASLMTESVRGKTRAEAEILFAKFRDMVTGVGGPAGMDIAKLVAFSGVREFPVRVKCATLAWHTLHAALEERRSIVSTE
jgi:nitrogen fixation protein NifU and related proteins